MTSFLYSKSFFLPSACGGTLVATSEDQELISPGYPDSYPDSLECTWTLTAGPARSGGGKVFVTVLDFHLERGFDYLFVGE